MSDSLTHLHLAEPLPNCPHCGSAHVASGFSLDWIEVPPGAWSCADCGSAFIPEAWKPLAGEEPA
jgi:transposase-like protein